MEYPKIIAVDFDGTLAENAWPGIGLPIYSTIVALFKEQSMGAKVILWTNRTGERLDEAVVWCKEMGIVLDAVNENLPEMVEFFGGDCRKVFANEYWDDRAVVMPPVKLDQLRMCCTYCGYGLEPSGCFCGNCGRPIFKPGEFERKEKLQLATKNIANF